MEVEKVVEQIQYAIVPVNRVTEKDDRAEPETNPLDEVVRQLIEERDDLALKLKGLSQETKPAYDERIVEKVVEVPVDRVVEKVVFMEKEAFWDEVCRRRGPHPR